MAKPGSDDARKIGGKAHDLARLSMSPAEVLAAGEFIEATNGLRCAGCGRRIARGFEFVSISPRDERPMMKQVACSRDDCDWATICRTGATYVRQIEIAWLDSAGADAQPAKAIVERRKQMDDKAAAKANGKPSAE
jgi:hypothetical protein